MGCWTIPIGLTGAYMILKGAPMVAERGYKDLGVAMVFVGAIALTMAVVAWLTS